MQITTRILRNWADEGNIPDLTLAELDYRLVHALQAIFSDPFLRARLCLKGGTALNKLYLHGTSRLSVDLDFNAVGPREQVLRERTPIGDAVAAALRRQDSRYGLTYRGRYDQLTVYARFSPLSGTADQRLKLEVSFVERVAIMGRVERPVWPSPLNEPLVVDTYHLEELLSTKLRALYDRRKGRDIYDLLCVTDLDLDLAAIRKMVLYYFYRANKVFSYPAFVANVERKVCLGGFRDDARGLIRHGTELDWEMACHQVLSFLTFLAELDDRDELFLDLAKALLGKPYPKARATTLAGIEHPLAWLMEGLPISGEAQGLTQEDIKLHVPGQGDEKRSRTENARAVPR
ncbi:MAG TPA: nucleotidyl transferase AbiEii/AbiGii toxin family protein [Anaerolineae bacterium]|nr:nucleotidyl transferase AbiEii/AbiGii toxin family protein [Anaerolineae bacterium]